MNTTIQKWGNSLAVRLPKGVTETLDFHEGNQVRVKADGKRIIITPVIKKNTEVQLSELLQNVTPQNKHKESAWGETKGNEAW